MRAEQLQQQQLKDARIAHEQAEAARMREIINGKTDEEVCEAHALLALVVY